MVTDQAVDRRSYIGRVLSLKPERGITADLGERASRRGSYWHTTRHRLERWRTEAFIKAREHDSFSVPIERHNALIVEAP
jgi:hypothetical protein